MRTIRLNTFETNSSSCHCLVVCGQNKLKEFRERKVIALSDVRISSDYDVSEITIPDSYFISIEDAFNKVVKYCEAGQGFQREDEVEDLLILRSTRPLMPDTIALSVNCHHSQSSRTGFLSPYLAIQRG